MIGYEKRRGLRFGVMVFMSAVNWINDSSKNWNFYHVKNMFYDMNECGLFVGGVIVN